MINVFEKAFLANSAINESVNTTEKAENKTKIKESVNKTEAKAEKVVKESVALNKLRFTKEDVENLQPEEDVMVVYNPDLTDDMSAEDVEAAADALIGHDICKCGVCGANYVGDCDDHKCEEEPIIVANEEDFVEAEPADDENEYDDFSESLLFKHITEDVDDEEPVDDTADAADADTETDEDTTESADCVCPVCGATENQIVVGEIAPIDDEDDEEPESSEEPETTDNTEDAAVEEPTEEPTEEETESEESVEETEDSDIDIDESVLNRLFNKFAAENYDNVKRVKFNHGCLVNGELRLEGKVLSKKGSVRPIVITSEGFKLSDDTTRIRISERGPFTESAVIAKNRVPFVLECKISDNKIDLTALKYQYTVQESAHKYSVFGREVIKG